MVAHYCPLILLGQLDAMPQDYHSRIAQFDGTGTITTQKHIDRMHAYSNLQEVDEYDVRYNSLHKV